MRKLAIAILVVIVVLVVIALVAPRFIDVNRYHDRVQAELSSKLGRQVTVGQMHLSLLPLSFRVENLNISDDPRFQSARPFAVADQVTVNPVLMSLIHGDVEIKSVELIQPKLELVKNPQGAWNLSTLGQPAAEQSAPQTAPSTSQKPAPAPQTKSTQPNAPANPPQQSNQEPGKQRQFALDSLKISDGQVGVTDLQKRQARAVYDHIDLELSNFAPDKRFGITLAAHLPGSGAQRLELKGEVGPLPSGGGDILRTPIDGTLKLDQVSLAGLKKFMNSQALAGTDATLSGDLSLKNTNGVIVSSGNLKAEQVSINGTQIGYPISADYRLNDDLNTDQIKISEAALKLGPTPLNISGTIDAKPTPMQIDLRIQTSNASLTEAARLAQAAGIAFGQGTEVAGRLNADISARGAADKPALNGQLSASALVISGKGLPQPVRAEQIALTMTPQQVQSNDFAISTGGTSLKMRFTMSQYESNAPAIDATVSTNNANLGEVLNIAKAYGVSAAEDMSGTGMLDLNVHVAGPLKNTSALAFNGTGRLQNANIKSASLAKPLIVRNAGLQFSSNSVVLQNLNASLGQTNATGELTMKNFAAPVVQFTLNADKIAVAEWEQMFNSAPAKSASKRDFNWSLLPQADAQARPAQHPPQQSPLANVSGGGSVQIGLIDYDQLQLNNVKSQVALDHGVIRLSPLTAQIYGGQENGSITLDTRTNPSTVTVASSLSNVDANKLISSVSSLKQTLYGLLAANTNSTFQTGASADAIARSLNGRLSLNLANGKLANIDLLSQIGTIAKFLNGAGEKAQPFTTLSKLTGDFNVVNGLATTNNLKAVLAEGATLAASGNINLVNNGLDLHLTAVLPNQLSQQVGGTSIGGFMQTALANRNGELVVPILVSGTFSSPKFAPDLERVAQMKLQNLVPTLQNPGGLLSGILGGNGGNAGQGAQGAVGQILGALGGRQNQQQQNQQQPNQQQQEQNQQAMPQSSQPPQQQQPNVGDILNQILNQKKKKQEQQQQPQQNPKQPPQ